MGTKSSLRASVLACGLLSLPQPAAASDAAPNALAVAEIRSYLESQGSPAFLEDDRDVETWRVIQSFYFERGFAPAWVRGNALTPGGQALARHLALAAREALPVSRYDPRRLAGSPPQVLAAAAGNATTGMGRPAQVDVALSFALARYAADLFAGSVDPRGATSYWRVSAHPLDVAPLLAEAARTNDPVSLLARLRPVHPQYALLQAALAEHRAIASRGGWPALPATLTLKTGRRSPHVATLRARLVASRDLPRSAAGSALYAGAIVDAVKRFERRHALRVDGVVDKDTLAALNVPVEDRIRQIELALERWRWQQWRPGERSVLVNIPTFQLHAYDDGQEALTMRVITGQGDSPTPVFEEEMETVVFSPHWNVPANILETEVLPAMKRDRGYLARQNMEMIRGEDGGVSVRQRPGPRNSLGLVKFLFPNPFHVYLHDTPGDSLFARERRAFSHGCVRLEKPEELARFVLRGTEWTDATIARAMRSGREQFVALPAKVPVTIAYFTTWVDADGTVRFAPDVYRHDLFHDKLMPIPRPTGTLALARS